MRDSRFCACVLLSHHCRAAVQSAAVFAVCCKSCLVCDTALGMPVLNDAEGCARDCASLPCAALALFGVVLWRDSRMGALLQFSASPSTQSHALREALGSALWQCSAEACLWRDSQTVRRGAGVRCLLGVPQDPALSIDLANIFVASLSHASGAQGGIQAQVCA